MIRFTPYRIKTPASRRLKSRQRTPGLRNDPKEHDPEHWTAFTKHTFQAYKVTPLHEFNYSIKHLKYYGRMLAAFMKAEASKGVGISVGESADDAYFSIKKGIKTSEDDAECIQIILQSKPKSKAGTATSEEKVMVLTAYLCSVNIDSGFLPRPEGRFTTLPLLLIKGTVSLSRLLCNWLERQFDCSTSILKLSPHQLSWMVAMWSGTVPKLSSHPVQLHYATPKQMKPALKKITMTIDAQDCKQIWKRIHTDSNENDFKEEEVTTFIKSIERHFHHLFGIHLSRFHLERIGTAIALIGINGKVKMYSPLHAINVLDHLTELCAEQVLAI